MEQLIKITDYNGRKAVSARELHAFLESKQDFSDWIKNRINKYGFIENQDFEVFHNFMENPSGGRPLTEYALSINCAKEISMVEGNAKGKQARQYFITCETLLKDIANNELAKEKKRMDILKQKSHEVLDMDRTIGAIMKKRRFVIKEINQIIRSNSAQLDLFPEFDYLRAGNFPNKPFALD